MTHIEFLALQHFYGPECEYLKLRAGDDKTEREILGLIEMVHAFRTRVLDHLEMDMRQAKHHTHDRHPTHSSIASLNQNFPKNT